MGKQLKFNNVLKANMIMFTFSLGPLVSRHLWEANHKQFIITVASEIPFYLQRLRNAFFIFLQNLLILLKSVAKVHLS